MKYSLGLDIGIASIGWSVINLEKQRIEDLGVRTFVQAENPKDGSPLAEPRRLARGTRRRLRRRSFRKQRIAKLLAKHDISFISTFSENPFELRTAALDRLLNQKEWAIVLKHLASKRGFKSNRKSELEDNSENGALKPELSENRKILNKYRSVGEMFFKDTKFSAKKNNGPNNYSCSVWRSDLEAEIQLVFQEQRKFGNTLAAEKLEQQYLAIWNSQRPFASEDQIIKLVGYCELEPTEKRAPKNSYSFEQFSLWSKINNIELISFNETLKLTLEQKKLIADKAYGSAQVKFSQIRKWLGIDKAFRFNLVRYVNSKKNDAKDPEDQIFFKSTFISSLKSKFKKADRVSVFDKLLEAPTVMDEIGYALTSFKTDEDIRKHLADKGISTETIELLLELSFSKYGHLSFKALKAIIPHLKEGLTYDKACQAAGYNHSQQEKRPKKFLPVVDARDLTNPVVKRSLAQSRKVINALIAKFGSPTEVHIEMAREVAKSFSERRLIEREQSEKAALNEQNKTLFKDTFKREPVKQDLFKFKLWREQNSECAYSQKPISTADFENAQIDHAIPYSRSFDDSYYNKVLVLASENQNKLDRTPFEYMGQDEARWHKFEQWVLMNKNYPRYKKENLLRKEFSEETARELSERNLNDTKYISRFIKNYIELNLEFAESDSKQKVFCVNGRLTNFLRVKWGLYKASNKRFSDKNHALDATIIALTTQKNIQKIAEYAKNDRLDIANGRIVDITTGEIIDKKHFPPPWENFHKEMLARLIWGEPDRDEVSDLIPDDPVKILKKLPAYDKAFTDVIKPIFVSRAPKRRVTGEVHAATIKSAKTIAEGFTLKRTPITAVKLNDIEKIYGGDEAIKKVLKERLEKFEDNPDKAFVEPIYKPSNTANKSAIKSVLLPDPSTTGVLVNKGIASNGGMVRVDVFKKTGRFYLVPVYLSDVAKNQLPNKAISAGKKEADWDLIDATYEFLFSLYQNDFIQIEYSNRPLQQGYYVSTHRSTGAITIALHDRNKNISPMGIISGIGVKTAQNLTKYSVDVLGGLHKIVAEKRHGFSNSSNK